MSGASDDDDVSRTGMAQLGEDGGDMVRLFHIARPNGRACSAQVSKTEQPEREHFTVMAVFL